MLDQPLSGVKVLDLTWHLSGPYCTKLLADYGADVIKVERPDGGDPARRLGPFPGDVPHAERSGTFLLLNTNKRGVTLDLKSATGRQVIRQLARDVDLVVESFRPGVMERLGLDYETLSRENPRLVMTRVSSFGQTGPYRDWKATEIVMYGMGGSMHSVGLPERHPIKLGGSVTLFQGGHVAAVATMMALFTAATQGIGQVVDLAVYETAAGSIDRRMGQIVTYQYSGRQASREPNLGRGYPNAIWPCADGYFDITGGPVFFPRIAQMMGMPELVDRYGGIDGQSDPDLKEQFETEVWLPWLLSKTKAELLELGQKANVLCGVVSTSEDLMHDPQFAAREYFVPISHPEAGTFLFPGAPVKFTESPWALRRPAPLLGQHNEEVLCDLLGYRREDLVLLRGQGVI